MLIGSMRGPAAGAQLLLVDSLRKTRLHEIGQHFLAHLGAELLADDLDRRLAGTEALELAPCG